MALTLLHTKFKTLIDGFTGIEASPVYISEAAPYPAMAYACESIHRDIDSNLRDTTISMHVFSVFIASFSFKDVQDRTQILIDSLDQYSDSDILLTLVDDCSDGYDADKNVYYKAVTVSLRVRE